MVALTTTVLYPTAVVLSMTLVLLLLGVLGWLGISLRWADRLSAVRKVRTSRHAAVQTFLLPPPIDATTTDEETDDEEEEETTGVSDTLPPTRIDLDAVPMFTPLSHLFVQRHAP